MYSDTRAQQKDLYQDILLALWRSLSSYNGDSDDSDSDAEPSTWLYRVALNTALSHDRRQTVREEATLSDDHPLGRDVVPSCGLAVERQDRLDRLFAAIGRLDDATGLAPRFNQATWVNRILKNRVLRNRSGPSDSLEPAVLHFVGRAIDYKHVSDRRAPNAIAAERHHGARIGRRRFVPHHAEGSPQRVAAAGRLHVDGCRALVFVLPVGPGQIGPLLENAVSIAGRGVLPVVDLNGHDLIGGDCLGERLR